MTKLPTVIADAISIDEVGIESGRFGQFRLKSAYQPIFRRMGGMLEPFAVEGLVAPYVAGCPVPSATFFETVAPEDALFVEGMCRALHLRNHHNIGAPWLELFFNFDPGANDDLGKSVDEIRFMVQHLREVGLDSRLLVCEITETHAVDPLVMLGLADEMRRHGIRIAIDDFGAGQSTVERVDLIRPDIVKIDGAWFRKFAADRAASRLIERVVSAFYDRRTQVLIEGIETVQQLRTALDAGADYLQGFMLGRPTLAGAVFEHVPLSINGLLNEDSKVVRLFG